MKQQRSKSQAPPRVTPQARSLGDGNAANSNSEAQQAIEPEALTGAPDMKSDWASSYGGSWTQFGDEYQAPNLATALNSPETAYQHWDDEDAQRMSGAFGNGSRWIEIDRGVSNPLRTTPTSDADLVTEVSGPTDEAFEIGAQISDVKTPLAASTLQHDLYVNGAPRPTDVSQGAIGDCYLMAAMVNMAEADPGHLMDIMSFDGQTFSVTLHRLDEGSGGYVPVNVSVGSELATYQDDAGNPTPLGARMVWGEPEETWWASAEATNFGSVLEVFQDQVTTAALWVPLLEKAYALFAQQYGQYGAGSSNGIGANGQSGYDIIGEGGFSHLVYAAFYGDQVRKSETRDMSYDASEIDGNVLANKQLIADLLRASGVGIRDGYSDQIMAFAMPWDHLKRLADQVHATLIRHPEIAGTTAETRLTQSLLVLERYIATDGAGEDCEAQWQQINDGIVGLVDGSDYPALVNAVGEEDAKRVLELAADLATAGTDSSSGRRNVYSGHAYAVTTATFLDAEGKPLELHPRKLDEIALGSISSTLSTIEVTNPHHTNEPNMQGQGPEDGVDDGAFTMTLDAFLRSFTSYDYTNVKG